MKKTISILCMVFGCMVFGALPMNAQASASRYQIRLSATGASNVYNSFVYGHDGNSQAVGYTSGGSSHGPTDILYSTIDKWGNFTGYTSYYTTSSDYAYSIDQFAPTSFVVSGSTNVSGNYDILVFLIGSSSFTPEVIGGTGNEEGYSIHSCNDGGYIIAGYTTSFGAGGADGYLVKLTSTGAIAWTSTYGTSGNDYFYDAIPTSDGGYMAVGRKPSCFSSSLEDEMAVKFTSTGTVSWARCIGNPGVQVTSPNEWANAVAETTDGYVFSGTCNNGGGFAYRMFLTKLTKTGAFVFMNRYDESDIDYGYDMIQTADGGFLLSGSRNGDASLIKTTGTGALSWAKIYNVDNSSSNTEIGHCVHSTEDGYEVAGVSYTSAFFLRTDFNGVSGCNEAAFTPTTVAVTPVFGTLGTTNGTGGTVSSITLLTGGANPNESSYNCRLCPVDAGPDVTNFTNSCCSPNCTPVLIGTPGLLYYAYNWTACSALSSCTIAQPYASPCATTSYTLTVSRNDCTTNTDAVTVTNVFGSNCCGPKRLAHPGETDSTSEYQVNVFPNPSNGSFHIEYGDGFVSSIIITDVQGRKVYENNNLTDRVIDVDLSSQTKGVYLITSIIDGQTITQKINIE
jgi:hypothetical protein